jgi:hypothetical protein
MNNKYSNNTSLLILVLILTPVLFLGLQLIDDENISQSDDSNSSSIVNTNVVWAVNVGGTEYVGVDGISYKADTSLSSLIPGDIGNIETIKGSQDSFIYQSFRSGELTIKQPIENGFYDITFKFAEPEDNDMDARVFNVYAEQNLVISDLNVRLARDGKHISALARAVYDWK